MLEYLSTPALKRVRALLCRRVLRMLFRGTLIDIENEILGRDLMKIASDADFTEACPVTRLP